MKKIDMLKASGEFIISVGVGMIISNGIALTTPLSIGPLKKVCITVGSFVVANMVADKACDYAEEKVDEMVETVKEVVKEIKEAS